MKPDVLPSAVVSAAPPSHVLADFDISTERGFLPAADPLLRLPRAYDAWEDTVAELPKLIAADRVHATIEALPALDPAPLHDGPELDRAMLLLSYIGHGYVWTGATPSARVPAPVAVPWREVARRLGRPPVLSYASHALVNWRRYDTSRPPTLGNSARLLNFCGGTDEDWFVLVHIEIESKAGPIVRSLVEVKDALAAQDPAPLGPALATIAETVRSMVQTLKRMPERCDPFIYYTRVRPYIFGWLDNPALPDGLWYDEGSGQGTWLKLRGETGAQSSIIPSIDAVCGIDHEGNALSHHLHSLREYMPAGHRRFIEFLEGGPRLRDFLIGPGRRDTAAVEAYNAVVLALAEFRRQHLEFAGLYIHAQSQRTPSNPVAVGTGGTPFMQYLKMHGEQTERHLLR
jgi:indoleamine 2,3-dioxygenase